MRTFTLLFLILISSAHATFRFRVAEDRGTLDWGNGEVNQDIVLQLMDGLTRTDKNGEAIPAIAEKWNYNPKTGSYDFYLKKDARWSDGELICAKHFVDAWRRASDSKFASPYAHYFQNLKSFTAESCAKLHVELKEPVAFFPELVSHWVFFPIRNDLIQKNAKDWTQPEHLVVTGPYLLKKWTRDTLFVLEQNEKYHGQKSKEKTLEAYVVSDDSTALDLYEKQKLDWIRDLPYLEKKKLSKRSDYVLSPTDVTYFLGFSFHAASLSKSERCQIIDALDTKEIPKFMQGAELPLQGFVPQTFATKAKIKKTEFAPIEIQYYAKDIHAPLMEWIQQTLRAKLNTEVGLIKNEGKTYWSKLAVNPPAVFLSGITAMYSHPHAFLSELRSDSKANWGRFNFKKYDLLVDELASQNPKSLKAKRAINSAQKILIEDECAVIPLYQRQTANLVAKKVKGFQMNPLARVYLDKIQTD